MITKICKHLFIVIHLFGLLFVLLYTDFANYTNVQLLHEQVVFRRFLHADTHLLRAKISGKLNANYNPSWEQLNHLISSPKPTKCIRIKKMGRLGNHMFQVALLTKLAIQNKLLPAYFGIPSFPAFPQYSCPSNWYLFNWNWKIVQRTRNPDLKINTVNLTAMLPNQNILLSEYIVATYDFQPYENILRQMFTFKPAIIDDVIAFYGRSFTNQIPTLINTTWVGIHVRRGDWNTPKRRAQGYIVPNATYFKAAMNFIDGNVYGNITYIVCSEDKEWATQNILPLRPNIIMSNVIDGATDMAILAACNHVIRSIGTFGWWSGFLAGGMLISPSSKEASGFAVTDFTKSKRNNIELTNESGI